MAIPLVGKLLKYVYDNGWEYHVYYENEHKISYNVLGGPAGGRCAYQEVNCAEVAPNVFNVAWYEETGTVVSQVINLNSMTLYGFIAFPHWVWSNPEKTHGRKEQKLQELLTLREVGPDAPRTVIYELAKIFSVEDIGIDVPNVF
jgi:phenolic acid decarboxylase